jgi:hypothetical protein
MQKMDNFNTYQNPAAGNGLKDQAITRADSLGNLKVYGMVNDSLSISSDSTLLLSRDSIYYFGQTNQKQEKEAIYFQFKSDLGYAEQIMWKGLKIKPREKTELGNDWLTGILFLVFVLFASVKAGYSKYISSLFQSLFNYPTSFRMFREKNYSLLHGAIRLEILYYIVFSIFIFQIIVLVSDKSFFTLTFFGATFAAVVVYFLGKKLAYYALGSIFIGANDTSEFLFNMDNYNRGAGIVLFPIVALMTYFPSENYMFALFLGVLTTLFFYVMLLKRGISILLKKQFPIFYLFLYLCTLEILPLLLIYKIVVD